MKIDKVTSNGDGTVDIHHSQSFRLTIDYQGAESQYGVRITVPDNKLSIRKGFKRATKLVELSLHKKVAEQAKYLKELANDNRS